MKSLGWVRNFLVFSAVLFVGLFALAAVHVGRLCSQHSKEAALKEDLVVMRKAIKCYFEDHQRPPQSLQTLLDEKYLREIPKNPYTRKPDWVPHFVNFSLGGGASAVGLDDVYASPPHSDW